LDRLDRSPFDTVANSVGKRRRHAQQTSTWVATNDLPRSAAQPFYARLNTRSSMATSNDIGYFEGLDAERAIAFTWMWQRLADAGVVKGETVGLRFC